MKVLIISSSLRAGSNSELAAIETQKGAKDAGHEVELISLKDKDIRFCKGCLACQKMMKCVIKDDAPEIVSKIQEADAIVFVTPIYYYELSGQLKTLLDRCNPLYPQEYSFSDIYLLTTSAEGGQSPADTAVQGIQGWIDCFNGVELKGRLNLGGVNDAKEIVSREDMLKQAYDFGKAI